MNQQGLYEKFTVQRTDGSSQPGGKHAGCHYFVLDMTHDQHALPALAAYAKSCADDYPQLAIDLNQALAARTRINNVFVTVPESIVAGKVVPTFQVGQYLAAAGPSGSVQISATAAPWVNINFADAKSACAASGLALITELQALAIAQDIANQPINWSGGAVGEGHIYQGIHKDNVQRVQAGTYVSPDPDERRWHELSNGERIYDFAGNAFTWVFDDVQGDEDGIVARDIEAGSPSLATAPAPSMRSGMGWRPTGPAGWSGSALIRGGCFFSGDAAGVFNLDLGWPGYAGVYVGFRCTK